MYNTDDYLDKVILFAVESEKGILSANDSLDELEELVKTSGGVCLGRIIQRLEKPHYAHYFGKGKLDELKDLVSLTGANGVVCDDELTGTQQKKLSEALDVKIMDRTMVILDIFAKNAHSKEGKVQVEMAMVKYQLSHLIGYGKQLSRLGGGIGTRGPGEKKLETDRRAILDKISALNDELKEIGKHREVTREKRKKSGIITVSLIGYTNSGKSTLLNTISSAGVLAEDKLFATLDTTSRKVKLPSGVEIVLSDTVGFIQKIPHNLIKSFKTTLDELQFSDILIHVVDSTSDIKDEQMQTVYQTIKGIVKTDKKFITAYNKTDKLEYLPFPKDENAESTVCISALTGQNVDLLLEKIDQIICSLRKNIEIFVPFSQMSVLDSLYKCCEVLSVDYEESGCRLSIICDNEFLLKFNKYLI